MWGGEFSSFSGPWGMHFHCWYDLSHPQLLLIVLLLILFQTEKEQRFWNENTHCCQYELFRWAEQRHVGCNWLVWLIGWIINYLNFSFFHLHFLLLLPFLFFSYPRLPLLLLLKSFNLSKNQYYTVLENEHFFWFIGQRVINILIIQTEL